MRSPTPRHVTLLLCVVSVLALSPIFLDPVAVGLYFDNAPHLAEVQSLAQGDFLSHTVWAPRLNAGTAVGQLNGPLAWMTLAALQRLGLGGLWLYIAGILSSNVVFTLGIRKVAERLSADPMVGLIAGLIAACSLMDLYGFAGAASGMWPHRLANGVFLLGWPLMFGRLDSRRAGGLALWLGLVSLLHTFSAVVGFGCLAAVAVHRAFFNRREAGLLLAAGAGAALMTSGLVVPLLLEPGLRLVRAGWKVGPLDSLLLLTLPFQLDAWVGRNELRLLGGAVGWSALLPVVLTPLGLWRARERLGSVELRLMGLGVFGLILVGAVLFPYADFRLLGPNPWRHYVWLRVLLAILAGWALAPWVRSTAAGLGLAGVLLVPAVVTGSAELSGQGEVRGELEQAWAAIPDGPGRIFHQDSFGVKDAPAALFRSHAGAALYTQRDLPVLGSWYTVSPTPTVAWTTTESGLIFGVAPAEVSDPFVEARLKLYGVDRVVSVGQRFRAILRRAPSANEVYTGPNFSVFVLDTPAMAVLGTPPPATVEVLSAGEDRVQAQIHSDGPTPFRLRMAYHPWWRAELDGLAIELEEGADNGLVQGVAPQGGTLTFRWEDRGRHWWLLSLLSVLGLMAIWRPALRRTPGDGSRP